MNQDTKMSNHVNNHQRKRSTYLKFITEGVLVWRLNIHHTSCSSSLRCTSTPMWQQSAVPAQLQFIVRLSNMVGSKSPPSLQNTDKVILLLSTLPLTCLQCANGLVHFNRALIYLRSECQLSLTPKLSVAVKVILD